MKKKIYIEITESRHPVADIHNPANYSKPGFYLNTDETGTKALVFMPKPTEPTAPIWGISIYDYEPPQIMDHVKTSMVKPRPEPTPATLEVKETDPAIKTDEVLKILAVAQRPELVLKLTGKNEQP